MFSTDFYLGAVWTLIAVCLGAIIGFVLVLLLADRPDAGGGAAEDPAPDPWDDYFVMDDDAADEWLREHTLRGSFEAELLP